MVSCSRHLASAFVVFIMAIGVAGPAAAARYASIVVEAESGAILYSRNADHQRYPASLVKMMTLYLTFESLEGGRLSLDQALTVSKRAAGQTPSKLGLKHGSTITVEDAILAVVTKSANDAATVLAEALGETEVQFAARMTERAKSLGMVRTRFTNATGLPNRRQRTTARDMATLAFVLLDDFPQYYHYFATPEFSYKERTYENHNQMLESYAGTDGIKTGYIRASGFNLVASVQRGGRRLIGVVFGGRSARSRDSHLRDLLDKAFARPQQYYLVRVPAQKPARVDAPEVEPAAAPPVRRQPEPTLARAAPEPRSTRAAPEPELARAAPELTPARPAPGRRETAGSARAGTP